MISTFRKLVKQHLITFFRPTNVSKAMDTNFFNPPSLKEMKVLDRDLIKKPVQVPVMTIKDPSVFNPARQILKPYFLKIPRLKCTVKNADNTMEFIINPLKVTNWSDFNDETISKLEVLGISKADFETRTITLTFDNWNADELLRAVIPDEMEIARGYSLIGHILHLNLKDHLLEYKHIIGTILMAKTPRCRTVVNKLQKIDNTYRNFEMEVICGDNDFVTQVRENHCQFEFDLSKVYWNPRLSSEHQRIVNLLTHKDVLLDVFCGVGPFAIPCAKKGAMVFANDLNPDCFKWIKRNVLLNKIQKIELFNKDGAEFIQQDIRRILLNYAANDEFIGKIHVTMNLPALALSFIKNFKALFSKNEMQDSFLKIQPIIHIYFFAFDSEVTTEKIFEEETGLNVKDINGTVQFVRNVSPNKDMMKISFALPADYALNCDCEEPNAKRPRAQI